MGRHDNSRRRSCQAGWERILLLSKILGLVASFTPHRYALVGRGVDLSMAGESDFLSKVTFFAKESPSGETAPTPPTISSKSFDPVADALIGKSKSVIASDLGIQDPSLLAEEFLWIGPFLEKPLGKLDYLAAGRFFTLRTAFPDLDYRPHDFRIDKNDPLTVRCTVRPVGVMRGPLRLRNELVQPNGKQWRGPPEAISFTFDSESGKVIKLCSGFAMDRLVGNTNGLCGVMAAATVAGVPPSDWEVYPIPTVLTRFFGRPVDPIAEVSTFLAPFPETVMIQLVKGILTTNLAVEDPALLAKEFTFTTPSIGPIGKTKFLESYAAQEFGGFEPQFSHFRVDSFDPYRVWVDVKPVGPGLEGPPQAFSFTFDDDGYCTRMTAGAVMDPSIGNTGGLSGAVGIKYASGEGELDFVVRPFPVAIGRLKKTILSPLTKISADDYILDSTQVTRNDDDGDTDTVESRKALTSARMRIQEEDAKKKLIEAEAVERLRAQQEAEEEKARAQQQADEELRRIRQEIEQQMYKRQDESKEESQQAATVNIPDLKFPTPPKVLPPKDLLPKVPKASQKVPSPSKAVTAKDSQAYSFSNVFKPLSKLSMPKAPSFDGILPKFDSMREMNDDVIQNKKRATVDVRIREQAKLDEQKATAAKQKAVFEEARKVRLEEQKLAAEQKKIDLAKRKAAAAAALASKNAVVNAAITKRKEEDEKNRRESEKRRQEAISKGVDALAGAFSTFQSQPYPMVKKERKQSEKGLKSPPARPLRRTQGAEPEAKAPQSPPRPSFQIPQFVNSEQDSRPKQPPTSRPRPSLQIPQSIKPSQKGKVDEESKSALLKPRPTLQIPKLAKIGVKAESTLAPPNTRPTITTPKEALPRQSLQIPKSSSAPRGVPSIVAWQKLRNGGVSGQIFGSTNFKEGERIETSTIATGKLENGSIIITESGSKYFLSGESAREITTATFNSATKLPDATRSKPRATLELTKLSKELNANAVQAALESQSKATTTASQQKRPTFSLKDIFGIDKSSDIRKPKDKATANESMTPPSPKTPAPLTKQAPKGMPTISRWKQKRDKSITGFISGSTAFPDGEKITTSPIARGVVEPGEVVTTSSGTKYFLQ